MHVTGENGVGKTSLLRLICGLTPIEQGDILWNSTSISDQKDIFRRELCYVGHANALQDGMSIRENLLFSCALHGTALDDKTMHATLLHFGLKGRIDQLIRHLSQGQKRRVALARLMFTPSRLWVLDEPFVAMDDCGLLVLTNLIASHLNKGGLAVITSHQAVQIGSHAPQRLELAP